MQPENPARQPTGLAAADSDGPSPTDPPAAEPWRWCPRCGHELVNQRCKFVCPRCGYFMSCSDFD